MRTFRGKVLSPGYAKGRVFLLRGRCRNEWCSRPIPESQVDAEIARFDTAVSRSAAELEALRERVVREIGEAESGIFDAHLSMLSDPAFVEKCRRRVREELVCIEHAVEREVRDLEAMLADVESEFIRDRGLDVRDVGRRLLRHLGTNGAIAAPAAPNESSTRVVIVADELLPSDAAQMDREQVVAVVTERGGPAAHATILARALAIPMVTDLAGIVDVVSNGDETLVDAVAGRVVVEPTRRQLAVFRTRAAGYRRVSQGAASEQTATIRTRDGVEIAFYGNIARADDARLITENNLAGVGLFRTECLFLNHRRPPTLRQHIAQYQRVTMALPCMPVTVRTLDLGGDKIPLFLARRTEMNPVIGMRGLRYSLAEKRMFRTQLRAIVRTAQSADVRVLFPMVLGVADLEAAIDILDGVCGEENRDRRPKLGAMIETPAAVFEIEGILGLVDFVTVGTNDLTQFMLAADRSSAEMIGEYSVLHPAVLKAIRRVLTEAQRAGVPVTVCGEAAGDPATAGLLVGLGARSLSMSPVRAARVRRLIRCLDSADMQEWTAESFASKTASQVARILQARTAEAIRATGLISTEFEFTG
jgi:phosphoenolpyruvate-protein phosphotransferase